MSTAVLISIRPKWCELIARGKKTIEIRKSRPKIETPFKCYIYCTKNSEPLMLQTFHSPVADAYRATSGGEIIGEFVCDAIHEIINVGNAFVTGKSVAETNLVARASCLDFGDLHDYLGHKGGYGWHITDLKIYDQPKELREFRQCHKCEYHKNCFEHEYSCDGTYALSRPPQSWCYVEDD